MGATYMHPSSEQIEAIKGLEIEGPIVLVNLLRFRPDGGAEQYARYLEAAGPFLAKVGATTRFIGNGLGTFTGAADEVWDQTLIIEYPNKQAFLDMTSEPDYPSAMRSKALLDSRLYCTQEH